MAVFQKPASSYRPLGRLYPREFEDKVSFQTIPAPAGLTQWVEHAWIIEWAGLDDRFESMQVMHRPFVDIFASDEGWGIQGTFRGIRSYSAIGDGRIVGVRFRPGAFHAFWPSPIAELRDRFVPLDGSLRGFDATLFSDVRSAPGDKAAAALFARLADIAPPADRNVDLLNDIITAIETNEDLSSVGAVAAAFGFSERWLQKLFKDYAGIGLKWFLQRHRLVSAAARIRSSAAPDFADMAYSLGYSSQQHFITDFRKVTGLTPRQYLQALNRS